MRSSVSVQATYFPLVRLLYKPLELMPNVMITAGMFNLLTPKEVQIPTASPATITIRSAVKILASFPINTCAPSILPSVMTAATDISILPVSMTRF